jgi:hypothetical protein
VIQEWRLLSPGLNEFKSEDEDEDENDYDWGDRGRGGRVIRSKWGFVGIEAMDVAEPKVS